MLKQYIRASVQMNNSKSLIDKLFLNRSLTAPEYEYLIINQNDETAEYARELADKVRREFYSNEVFVRGLIEIGNVCRNDCFYCGIRKSNKNCDRYILSKEQILSCCEDGYRLGFRTFVLQGGENVIPLKSVCETVSQIRKRFPDCAITLSLGEYEKKEYQMMFDSGADRYLLRHETADREHYEKLHPKEMSFEKRMQCLKYLKEIGFAVGCGFMVGSPYQTAKTLAKDLKFIEEFSPDMCGIGPFIPHKQTPFKDFKAGTLSRTVFLLSLIRLIKPNILLPSTTALGTISERGRELGILAGANVVMPNLSPVAVRKKYELYDNKICTGEESAQCKDCLNFRMKSIGFKIVTDRGDVRQERIE